MGMLVTLFLISTNVYSSINAPPERGFSYIELWMVGMQLPICIALVQYCIILGVKKNLKANDENSKMFINRKGNMELNMNQDDTIFKNIDNIFLLLSTIYFTIFCFCYWILLS